MPQRPTPPGALAQVVRDERARLVAILLRILGDWDLAEELVQDACVAALERWPLDGVPHNPAAWLVTVARRRAVDRLRRDARYRLRLEQLRSEVDLMQRPITTNGPMDADDRLRLLFTCCHPALGRDAQVALTLRTVAGLETPAVARAFLVPEPTIAQRLARAKRKIREAAIPYRVPDDDELPERLDQVLAVLYLVFNEGYLASRGATPERRELALDAEWLTSLLVELMPSEPEAMGLLALMRLHLARADGRFGPDGGLVRLADQDRRRWNAATISQATELLRRAERIGRPGPYQLQAAIVAVHAAAPSYADTDWARIVQLYDRLMTLQPSPVVALNRAVAVAELEGPQAALAQVEPLARRLDAYHLFHAVRADLLRRTGHPQEALAADRRALALTANPAEERILGQRIDAAAM